MNKETFENELLEMLNEYWAWSNNDECVKATKNYLMDTLKIEKSKIQYYLGEEIFE